MRAFSSWTDCVAASGLLVAGGYWFLHQMPHGFSEGAEWNYSAAAKLRDLLVAAVGILGGLALSAASSIRASRGVASFSWLSLVSSLGLLSVSAYGLWLVRFLESVR